MKQKQNARNMLRIVLFLPATKTPTLNPTTTNIFASHSFYKQKIKSQHAEKRLSSNQNLVKIVFSKKHQGNLTFFYGRRLSKFRQYTFRFVYP
jgi:hypothetical protein